MRSFKRLLSNPVIIVGALAGTACASSPGAGPSLVAVPDGDVSSVPVRLADCPSSPNCVRSDADGKLAPFDLAGLSVMAYQQNLAAAVESDGGVVRDTRDGYLWATYASRVFRFVDDIEWLYNPTSKGFDVRSAARTGYSDFGVNSKRVERLRAALGQ